MVQGGQEKRPKASPSRIGLPQPVLFQQAFKKSLGEILRIFRAVATASDMGEQRIPVVLTERREGRAPFGTGLISGLQHP